MANETRITLRLPTDLHTTIKSFADKNRRSMNEEIVTALSDYFNVLQTGGLERVQADINELREAINLLMQSRPVQ